MGLPGLNQYKARINVSAQGPQRSDAGEAQTRAPWSRVKHSTTEHSTTALPPTFFASKDNQQAQKSLLRVST